MTTRAKSNILSTGSLTRIGILAAAGVALSMLEIVILPGAPFYKLDPSGLAVMLAGFSMIVLALWRAIFIFAAFLLVFFGLVMRVLKNVFENAVEIKSENDFTI